MRRTATQRAVDAALIDVCRGRAPEVPTGTEATADFLEGARYHRIAPLAHVALRDHRPDLAAALRPDRDAALLNHLRVSALLGSVAKTLGDTPWLVFKGPMLSEFAHPIPGLRFYKDLDLLVDPSDFRIVGHRLLAAGWQILIGDDSLESKELPGEVPLVDQHGVVMDLHWSLLVMKSLRGRFAVEAGPLLRRRVPVKVGPASLFALDPADALVHVCHHAALAGATKLGHVLDADQLARQVVDWDAVIERAREWGATAQVAVVLGRAHRLLAAPVPSDLDRRLGLGRGLSLTLDRIDRTWPIQELRQDESWVRLITRALRPGLGGTVAATGHRAAKGAWVRMRPEAEKHRTPPHPDVVEAYLAKVEAIGSGLGR